jgi:ABC-2 type transport system ATP-binding protein
MEAVRAKDLAKVYRTLFRRGEVRAVNGLDLVVERGSVFGLLGPNGSGKTTTLLMLLGLLKPTSGEATVLGFRAGHREAKRRTGFLPEETRLFDFLTGAETLELVGRLFRMPRARRRLRSEELLRRTGMWEARHRRLSTYSKGMARRIGLAQALLAGPELLVLDEPTSGLDPLGNREVKDLLREEAARGTAVLLSSHFLADVADVCDEILIVHEGRAVRRGKVSELLADPRRQVWETDPMDAKKRARLEARFREEGVRLYGVAPPATTLESIFLEAIGKEGGDRGRGPP